MMSEEKELLEQVLNIIHRVESCEEKGFAWIRMLEGALDDLSYLATDIRICLNAHKEGKNDERD